jgi:hypothetical protein
MSGTEKAPGLAWRPRRDGSQVAYWIARKELVKAGYRPKSVRLHYELDDPALVTRCHALQAEMLDWATNNGEAREVHYDGTFASLVRFYETHPDSPYHELEQETQRAYSKTLALLMRHKGARLVRAVDGSDVRRWYKELVASHSKGWAFYTINVLKAVLSFAATKRMKECLQLRAELREAKFGGSARRREFLTHAQVIAFYGQAVADDYGWMGRCLLIQFEFGMRRRDVIGKYVRAPGIDGIRLRGRLWRDGLTWNNIDPEGIARRQISKTRKTSGLVAAHAIEDYPDLAADLAKTPTEQRIGPIVLNPRTGMPPTEAQCRSIFRRVARKVGIPDNVWNMDARAGANTEALAAGADQDERKALLTHTEVRTNDGYARDLIAPSRRAAAKRVGLRKE